MKAKYLFLPAAGLTLPVLVGFAFLGRESRTSPAVGRSPVAVEAEMVQPVAVADSVEVVGSLSPKFQVDVKSEQAGTVAEVYVTEWVRVTAGTPLARLDSNEIAAAVEAARAVVLQAEVNKTRASRELERALKLKEVGLITAQNLEDACTTDEAAGAAVSAARAQLAAAEVRLGKALIRAPMEGVVAFRGVNPGDYVENIGAPKPMFRIVDTRLLELTAAVPSTKIGLVRVGQKLTFTTDAVPGQTFAGKVEFINPEAEAGSRAVQITAAVPNGDGRLRSGLFVKGRIVAGSRAGVIRVDRRALLEWNTVERAGRLFVVDAGMARRRAVTTGTASGSQVEIVSGVATGDCVITRGAFNVRDGDPVKVVSSR